MTDDQLWSELSRVVLEWALGKPWVLSIYLERCHELDGWMWYGVGRAHADLAYTMTLEELRASDDREAYILANLEDMEVALERKALAIARGDIFADDSRPTPPETPVTPH